MSGIALIGSKWVSGELVFFNKTTGTEIMRLKTDGTVDFTANVTLSGITGDSQFISGEKFVVTLPDIAAADLAKTFFIAPSACKVVSAYERHVTVAGQAGTLTIEKLTTGEAPSNGDVVLAAAFDLTSTANTPVSKTAVTTAAGTLAAGDALCLKVASGSATSYALGTITVTLEWI